MNFFVTCYIYPIKKKIVLSQTLGFCLDNPRTTEDIELVKKYWERKYIASANKFPIKEKDGDLSLETILLSLRDRFEVSDEYLFGKFKELDFNDFFEALSQITILAYFDTTNSISLREFETPFEISAQKMLDYSYLLSLLIHTDKDNYYGLNFILDHYPVEEANEPTPFMWVNYLMSGVICQEFENYQEDDERAWTFFPLVRRRLLEQSETLESLIKNGDSEKLLYIGNMLRLAHRGYDEKARIILLTSILELLLTHNPDSNRFNVEDSINKQFQLKTAILVYLNDKNRDLNQIKKQLKTIYQQRSNVAHGNFNALEKYKQNSSHQEANEGLVISLYTYIRAVIEEYLKDRDFVEFLKNS